MENTTYELGPLLAEIRDGFRGMRDPHLPQRRQARGARRTQFLERDLASYT
jgi:hypothetical protein